MVKVMVKGDTITVDDNDSFLGKLIAGTEGKITVRSPHIKGGKREIKSVKNLKGESIGKVGKHEKKEKK